MPKEIDEDLIEATIRRVQARADAELSPEQPALMDSADEDAIAATIRRVREQAARAGASDPEADSQASLVVEPARSIDEDAIAATIRRVQEQAGQTMSPSDDGPRAESDLLAPEPELEPEAISTASGDDPVSETIRRVQAQAAARRHSESSDFAPAPLPDLDDGIAEETSAADQMPEVAGRDLIEQTSWPGRDERLLGEPASWEIAAHRLEQGLQDNSRQVKELAARLDALLPVIERFLSGEGHTPELTVVSPQASSAPDDWDDAPAVSPMQFGTPPRPAVLRDPAPHSAAARQLEEVPAPAAHLRPVDAGSLDDRLPRQYRITVEDKRRGVDLVPLHRAMQSLQNVRDMSLLSYNNGVAIVLVETVGALDPEALREAVGRAMARDTKIEVHNESTIVVKVQED